MFAVKAGVVNVAPVKIAVPPVGVVYHLKVAFGVPDDAVNVVVCPLFMVRVGGVTATVGELPMVTVAVARDADGTCVVGSTASA